MAENSHPASEYTSQERAALALWLLMQTPMTTTELATRLEMSSDGMRILLWKLTRVVPIFYHEGQWQVCQEPTTGGR